MRERVAGEFRPAGPVARRVTDLVSVSVSALDSTAPNPLLQTQMEMEPVVGIEPTTYGLRNRCSTTELHWQPSPMRLSARKPVRQANFRKSELLALILAGAGRRTGRLTIR